MVTSPMAKDVTITQPYVCQIHSQRHIEVRALENGYLKEIAVKEGQAVKKGDVLFRIVPILYKAGLTPSRPRPGHAQLKFDYTKKLADDKVSPRTRCHCSRPNWTRPRPRRIWRRPNWTLPTS